MQLKHISATAMISIKITLGNALMEKATKNTQCLLQSIKKKIITNLFSDGSFVSWVLCV